MNKHLYRLVFNRSLGLIQVVAEIAKGSGGKGTNIGGTSMATLQPLSFALWTMLGFVSVVPAARSQVVADPNAPGNQRPTVLTAPNGVPLVNIQTPSAAGVSRNTYSQFDVNAEGAILNNSRTNTQTQLGGWVQGNPWLATGTAKVILNEVNSSNPSHLNGYIEVAGDRAQVVIANPAGISVSGGGFLNASRATLTTGKPIINGGSLDGYRVEGGAIRIDGAGLDATKTDYTDLITRSLQLNGGLWANQLQATLGANVVSADHTQIAATTPAGTAPIFALDSSALGGMYANKITLLGTEHGVGVRNAGAIGAQAGDLVVTVDGRLINTGQIQAQNNAALDLSGGIANAGTISAGQELRIATPQDLDNSGGTLNARRLDVTAGSLANRGGSIEQTSLQALQLQAGALSNRDDGHIGLAEPTSGGSGDGGTTGGSSGGTGGSTSTDPNAPTVPAPPVVPLADGALRIAGTLDNDAGAILASGGVGLRSDSGLDNDGGSLGLASLIVSQGDIRNAGGTLAVQGAAQLHANAIDNEAGQFSVGGPLSLSAQNFNNRDGEFLHGGVDATTWQIAGALDNTSGRLATNATAFQLAAGTLVNEQGKIEHAGTGGMTLDTDQFLGSGGNLVSAGALQWTAGAVDHRNATLSAASVDVDAQSFDNAGGTIASGHDAAYSIVGTLNNRGGTLASAGDTRIAAETFANLGGSVQSAGTGTLDIHATTLDGATGTIAGNGALTITGQTTDLSGGTTSAQSVAIDTETLRTAGGVLSSAGTLNLNASQSLDNAGGQLSANGDTVITTVLLNNTAGTIQQAGAGTLSIDAATLNGAGGTLGSNGALAITGQATDLRGGTSFGQTVDIVTGTLVTAGGLLQSAGTLNLDATHSIDNAAGQIASSGDTTIATAVFDNQAGTIRHAGTGILEIDANTLNGAGGTIGSNGALTLTGTAVDLSGGTTSAQQATLVTETLSTAGGSLQSASTLDLTARQSLDNTAGVIASVDALTVRSGAVTNTDGSLATTGALDITAGSLTNTRGRIESGASAQVQVAGPVDNQSGRILAQDALHLDSDSLDNTDGLIGAIDGALDLSVTGALTNAGGQLQAGTDLSLRSNGLDNSGGSVQGTAVTVDAGTGALDNDAGRIAGRNVQIGSGALSNDAGLIQASTALTLDTHGQTLTNANSGTANGISSGGSLDIASGDLDNRTGVTIGAGPTTVQAAAIDNAGGQIGSQSTLALTGTGLSNVGGQVQAQGDADVNVGAGTLDNTTGLLASAANLTVTTANLINRDTQGSNQGVLGANTTIHATTIDNTRGLITAQQTATLTGSGALNNTAGELSAGTTLDLRDAGVTRAIDNTAGRIVAGDQLIVQAKSLTGNGAVQSGNDASLDLVDRFDNTGSVQANGDLTLDTQGDLTNAGQINAGNVLSVHAHAIDNAATGEITAANVGAHLVADTTLTNRGLIDSVATRIDAAQIDNLGTGRIYGDHVSLGAGTVNNLEETVGGVTRSGTIAARERLDIGAGTLNNRREALIYSGGDAAIGGALDADGFATGTAVAVNNTSAVIDVAGALAIDATTIRNERENVATTQTTTTEAPEQLNQPYWRNNGRNSTSNIRTTSNYQAYEVYYLNPADILEDTPYVTPDGYQVHKAVVRLTAQTSAYFFGRGGLYAAKGERSRINAADGTVTIYYFGRQDNQANPDQMTTGADDPFAELDDIEPGSPAFSYVADNLRYSPAYGTCTTHCVQLWAQYDYDDPDHILTSPHGMNDGSLGGNEQYRIATRTVTEDALAAGAGADAVIRSGSDMLLRVDGLTNQYGQIAAGGDLAIVGHNGVPVVTNVGQTLYRTYQFSNVSHAYDGRTRAWTNPSISEQIGKIGGTITSNHTLIVDAGDLSNLNVGRNAPNVVDPSVLVNLNTGTARDGGGANGLSVDTGTGVVSVTADPTAQAGAASGGSATASDTAGPATIRTLPVNFALPSSSLFQLTANEGSYLVETDPRFADYRQWLSSEYLLGLLGVDPAHIHKRLGDGYYEQRLVRDQVAQLTGRRFLDGYASDEEQFRALMNAGALFAQQYGLRPGIALTAAQMAQLTSDIVWLVEQTVTLPDGSTATVLVPQVYVSVQPGDLHTNGALLAGADVHMNLRGNLVNTGDIAGRRLVSINADNIDNLAGGAISGQRVGLQAAHDINVIGATVTAADALSVKAGGSVTVASTTATQSGSGPYSWSQTTVDRVAGLYVTNPGGLGVLSVSAGGDVTLQAAQIRNAGTEGVTRIAAEGNLNLGTVTTAQNQNYDYDAKNYRHSASSTEVGTTIHGAGDVQMIAGNDLNARAVQIDAGDAVQLVAGRDISIVDGRATTSIDNATHSQSSGFLSKKSYTEQVKQSTDTSIASNINAGGAVDIAAGRDYLQRGSNVVGVDNVSITAVNNATIESAQDTYHQDVQVAQKKSGFTAGYADGVASVGYSKSSSQSRTTIDATAQAASGVGSITGNTTIKAGNQLTIAGSDVAAGHNLTLIGQDVKLEARQDTYEEHTTSSAKKSGFSIGATINPADAYKAGRDSANAQGGNYSDSTIGKLAQTGEGISEGTHAAVQGVVVQAGSSKSSSQSDYASSTARTTQLSAGNNLTILATDGSITSHGAQLSAEGNATLLAKQNIDLDVAHNTESQSDASKQSGWGVATNRRMPVGVYNQKSNGNGTTDTITGTQVSAGGGVVMATQEGDITLTAAQVVGERDVNINAARNLTVQSGQDTAGNANHANDKAIGSVVISDTERFAGYHAEKTNSSNTSVTQVASNIGSLTGNVNLTAGETYTQTASNVVAANDVNVTAKRIELLTANDVNTEHQDSKDTKVGVFARVNSPLIDLVNNAESARHSDGRLATMQGMSAAASAYQAGSAISSMAGGAGGGSLLSAEAGIGFAQGKSQYDATSSTAVGSNISGGRNVTLTSTEGDIHGVQANLKAGDTLTLDSASNIQLEAGQSHYDSHGKSSNVGAEVGVGVSVGAQTGIYAYGQVAAGSSKDRSEATYYENSHLTGNTVNLKSKGDTTLKGADVRGNTINADVGGKLSIESVQDTVTQESKNSGVNARVQVSFGTAWSASGNVSSSKASGNYTAVNQQSGLFAGDGGYHVNADSVALKGGAITSTNAGNSELTANSLTYEHLQNQMDYQASSASVGGGVGGGSASGLNDSASQQASGIKDVLSGNKALGGPNNASFSGGVPMSESGKDSSTTYATLTEGNITIGGQKTTAPDLGLHTDAATAHTAIKELPDLQKVLADQQAMSAAAGNVIGTSQQVASDIANNAQTKADAISQDVRDSLSDAEKQAYAGMTPSQQEAFLAGKSSDYAQALGTAKDWGTGGSYSRALGAVTTALVGGIAGQGSTQVLSNALAPYAAQLIGNQFDANHGSDPNKATQLLSHALLGALLAEVNGGSAAGGALAGGGGELAAQVLTQQMFSGTDPKDLTEAQKQTISALSQAVGALASGIAGGDNGGIFNAAVGGNVAKNAVENNYLYHAERMQYLQEVKACDQGNADACAKAVNLEGLSANRNEALKAACVDSASAACKVEMDKAYAALQTQVSGEAEYWAWLAQNPLKLSKGEENSDVEALTTHTTLADLVWKIDCAKAGSDCSNRGSSQLLWQGDPIAAARHETMRTLLESAGKIGGVGGRAIDTVTGLYDLLKEASAVSQLGKTWTAIEYVNEHGLQAYLDAEQAMSKAMWSGLADSAKGYAGDIGTAIKNNLQGGPQWDIYDVLMQGNTEGKVGFDVLSSLIGGAEINALAKGVLAGRTVRVLDDVARETAAQARVFNGIDLHPDLPPPIAGYDYVPSELSNARTPNQANSHINGYLAEVRLANEIAGQGQVVVKWGDGAGTRGSDIISVNPSTGEVALWDSKYRSASSPLPESPTFANPGTRAAAVAEAERVIRSSSLSPQVRDAALRNLKDGNYTMNTAGSGNVRNSVQTRYCNNKGC